MDDDDLRPSRRTFLRAAASGAGLAVVGGFLPLRAEAAGQPPGADGSLDPDDAARVASLEAAAAGDVSQNGWPVPDTDDPAAIGVRPAQVRGSAVRLSIRNGEVATVLLYVAQRMDEVVERLRTGVCGGYSWRPIAGTSTWSNHASGTAIDLNWDRHPQGSRGTFTAGQTSRIREILASCGGAVRWGGDYRTTPDEMHFEIDLPPGDPRLAAAAAHCRHRIAVVGPSTVVKEGHVGAGWTTVAGAGSVAMDGERVAVVGSDGVALVKEGSLYAGWTVLATNAVQVALWYDRIGVLLADGTLIAKEGGVGAGWVVLARGVATFAVAGTRVAVVLGDGTVKLKEGTLGAGWLDIAGGASAVALDGARIGIVQGGRAMVKEGAWDGPWLTVHDSAASLVLAGPRIGVLSGGTAYLKEGPADAAWLVVATGVSDLALAGDRVGIVQGSTVKVKEGSLYGGWVDVAGGAGRVVLSD